MGFNFKSKTAALGTKTQDDTPPFDPGAETAPVNFGSSQPGSIAPKTTFGAKSSTPLGGFQTNSPPKPVSILKRGDDAKAAIQQENANIEAREALKGKLFEFFVPDDGQKQITFLDGALDASGMIDCLTYWQHTILHNGSWSSYACTAEADTTQPCPICASGKDGSQRVLVYVLTILDHTPHIIKKGPKAGQTIVNTRKLFVMKRGTYELLNKITSKSGGLAGRTFDVLRSGENAPRVGSNFVPVAQYGSYAEIAQKFGLKIEDAQPANYEEEIIYRSPEDLIALGLGKAVGGPVGGTKYSGGLKDNL